MSKNEKTLTRVAKLWAKVYNENESERDLVSESDWRQWENVRDEFHPFVSGLLEGDAAVSDADAKKLEDLESKISRATHKSREELEAAIGKPTESERKTRRNLLSLFKRK